MDFKLIKKIFYFLFAADIAAGIIAAFKVGVLAGIITAFVLLLLNIIVFRIILKMEKINGKTK
ncbi:MAG: hypothetical protein LBT79_08550 [Elusimicrobiota bacterium]|jgi:hypothetical protein|nr:hypothetical protein [Elusimicrobiota bacterium]